METFQVDGSFIRGVNPMSREVNGYVMTPHVTVDGRRISKDAFNHPTALTEFFRVPLFLWNHDRNFPIGRIKKLEMRGESGIYGVGVVEEDFMWNWILQGRVRGFSIGFKVLEWSVEETTSISGEVENVLVYNKAQLFDVSVVSSPANTYCLFVEPDGDNTFEHYGFPEQLKKGVTGDQLQIPHRFERVARSEDLPLYLPKRDSFDMFLPFERKANFLKEQLEMAGIEYRSDDWWVYGYATKFDEVDSYGTRMTRTAVEKALRDYAEWANVREQHDHHKAVGTAPLLKLEPNGLFIAAKISKGAPDTWEKILDGTLKGFSLGGVIKPNGILEVRENGRTVKNITDIELMEISLVDRPAVKSCGFTLACRDRKEEKKPMTDTQIDIASEAEEEEEEERSWPTLEELRAAAKAATEVTRNCPRMRAHFEKMSNYQTVSMDPPNDPVRPSEEATTMAEAETMQAEEEIAEPLAEATAEPIDETATETRREVTAGQIDGYEETGASGSLDLPLDMERSWDADAAVKRVREWAGATEAPNAKYRQAFFWYDEKEPENFGSYKLPFADVVEGRLTAIWRACAAAMAALKGARGGVDIPAEDRRAVYNRIVHYYRKANKEPPEFEAEVEDEEMGIKSEIKEMIHRLDELNAKFDRFIERTVATQEITSVMQQNGELIGKLIERLELLGSGRAASSQNGNSRSIWEGVVPSFDRFRSKRS